MHRAPGMREALPGLGRDTCISTIEAQKSTKQYDRYFRGEETLVQFLNPAATSLSGAVSGTPVVTTT